MVNGLVLILFIIGFLSILCVCGALVWLINYSIQRIEINIDDNYIKTTYRTARPGAVLKPLTQRKTWQRFVNWMAHEPIDKNTKDSIAFVMSAILVITVVWMWGSMT